MDLNTPIARTCPRRNDGWHPILGNKHAIRRRHAQAPYDDQPYDTQEKDENNPYDDEAYDSHYSLVPAESSYPIRKLFDPNDNVAVLRLAQPRHLQTDPVVAGQA